jgi:hypothetical protein
MTSRRQFRIRPLASDLPRRIRDERVDQFENTLTVLRDGKPHQCRVCLTLSRPDEGVILFSHRPFASKQPYAEVGPIFVHERECLPYERVDEYPAQFPRDAVVLRAYDERDRIVGAAAVGDCIVEDVIAEMFEDASVAYLHARNLGYGCYMFRVDRAPSPSERM